MSWGTLICRAPSVILVLEIIAPSSGIPGGTSRQIFREAGGTIGRDQNNAWTLADPQVSALHAAISYRGGTFYIEDRSRNGVFLNSPTHRLDVHRAYALNQGDRIYIHPYEIRVSVTA